MVGTGGTCWDRWEMVGMDHLANGLVETLLPETLMGSMSMSSFWTSIEESPGGDQPTSWTQVGAHVGHPAEGLAVGSSNGTHGECP